MKDHDSGAKEQAEEGGVAGATGPNVVPFPRSWYGAADELVPIRAADPPPRPAPTADASTFWGGESPAPDATAEGMAGADGSGFTQRPMRSEPRDAEPAPVWSSLRVGARMDPDRPVPKAPALNDGRRTGRRLRPALLAPLVCIAMLVAVVAASAPGAGGGHAKDPHGADRVTKLAATSSTRGHGPAAARTTARPTRRRARHSKHHATARLPQGRRSMASRPAVMTQQRTAVMTQQVTGSTPVSADVSPTGGGTPVTTAPASTSSASSPNSKTGGGAPAGALPDIQQTNQQP